jgi:hypothetical protein
MTIKVFLSYSIQDKGFCDDLLKGLSSLKRDEIISYWHGGMISPGQERDRLILEKLDQADLVLLLISANYISSDFCYCTELVKAMERHDSGLARVVPIMLSPVDWTGTPFSHLQALPENAEPVTSWKRRDEAYRTISMSLRNVVFELMEAKKSSIQSNSYKEEATTIPSVQHSKPTFPTLFQLEFPEGPVPLKSPFYIPSVTEERCYNELTTSGALIRIKSPSQMGKTSLMFRVLDRASKVGQRIVRLNLRQLNQSYFSDIQIFLNWLCNSIDRQLGLNYKPEFHRSMYSPNDNATQFVERVLKTVGSKDPIMISIDDFDRIFSFDMIRDDVFGLLRGWFEDGKNYSPWDRLRMIIVHSQDAYIHHDINYSPFNVGYSVKLDAFSTEQIDILLDKHNIDWPTGGRGKFVNLVAGHPYLLRLGLYHLASRSISLESLLSNAPYDDGVFGKHLQYLIRFVEQQPGLREDLSQVVSSSAPTRIKQASAFKLESLGLVIRVGQNVLPRCELYKQYVCNRWDI